MYCLADSRAKFPFFLEAYERQDAEDIKLIRKTLGVRGRSIKIISSLICRVKMLEDVQNSKRLWVSLDVC